MKILVASDSYKESLTSNEVNNIIKQAIFDVDSNIEVLTIPMADGGENSLECALGLENSKCIECEVIGPYGKKVNAHYVISNDLALYGAGAKLLPITALFAIGGFGPGCTGVYGLVSPP